MTSAERRDVRAKVRRLGTLPLIPMPSELRHRCCWFSTRSQATTFSLLASAVSMFVYLPVQVWSATMVTLCARNKRWACGRRGNPVHHQRDIDSASGGALGGEILSDHLRPHILPAERRSSFPLQTCGTCESCLGNARYDDGSPYPAMLVTARFSASRVAR